MNWAQALYHDAEFNLEDAQETAFSEWTKEATDGEGEVQQREGERDSAHAFTKALHTLASSFAHTLKLSPRFFTSH